MSRMLLGVLSVLWALGMMFGQFADALFALTPGLTLSNYYLWTFVSRYIARAHRCCHLRLATNVSDCTAGQTDF